MKRFLTIVGVAVVLYVAAYAGYRTMRTQVWAEDGRPYVIVNSRAVWYLFRPLTRLDAAATGIGSHLGPHRDSPRVLVDRAIAAAGGAELLGALRAFEWRGHAVSTVGGRTLDLSGLWRLQPPDSAIVTTTLAGQPPASARSMIISGARGWARTAQTITPLAPELVAHERDQFYLYHLMRLVPLRGSAYRISPLANDSLGRRRVRVSHARRPDVDLAFDGAGNLADLADSVTDPLSHARVRQQVRLAGWLDVAGVRWPRRTIITWDGKPYFDLEILEFRPLAELVDPLLGGPAPAPARRAGKSAPPRRATEH